MEQNEESISDLQEGTSDSWLDRTITKAISRKLTVFLVGTIFFVAGLGISADHWMQLAVAYVGMQGFIDSIVAYRNSG